MKKSAAFFGLAAALVATAIACSSSESSPSSPEGDSGTPSSTSSTSSSSSSSSSSGDPVDAATDAPKEANAGCEGTCKKTSLVVTLGGTSATLDRAQHGFEKTGDFYIESYKGGDPACPTMTSPTPDHTLIVLGIPKTVTPGTVLTEADGIKVTLLDFTGKLVPGQPPTAKATKIKLTVVAVDTAATPTFIAYDLDATFANGTAKGHEYTERCTSLDE